MAKKIRKKITTVRDHPLHVPISKKNPTGVTIRDRHLRRLKGTYLDTVEIESIFKKYDRKGLVYPTKGKLKFENADKYDETIAVCTDYFNKKFKAKPPLDPDVIKALISSESDFNPDPFGNRKIAIGIVQITKKTLKILQDPTGETKEFIFKDIRQKDLKDPAISIPMAVRWLHRKKETAASKLKRVPNHEEIILDYKGLLKSNSDYKKAGLKNIGRPMRYLKSNSIALLLCFFIAGCQSIPVFSLNTFHINGEDLHIISVNSNRVRQKCLFFNAEAENNWRHQYLMYILTDKNEVLEIMQSTNQDKDTCYSQVHKIEKILQPESQVKMCVRDELKKNIQVPGSQNKFIQFGSLGSYKMTYEALTFDSICNSKKCFSSSAAWINTCPGFVKQ